MTLFRSPALRRSTQTASVAAVLSVALFALLIAGCSSSPESRFYRLSALDAAAATVPPTPSWRVGIGALTLPDGIDRSQLVTRLPGNRVQLHDTQRWAESLKTEIPRVVAQNMAARLPGAQVAAYPQYAATHDTDYTVHIDITRFDGTPGDHVTLEALWSIQKETPPTTFNGGTRIRENIADGEESLDALVSAYNRALAGLSLEIADAIRKDRQAAP